MACCCCVHTVHIKQEVPVLRGVEVFDLYKMVNRPNIQEHCNICILVLLFAALIVGGPRGLRRPYMENQISAFL